MAALSDFFFNDFINSMTYNMLVNGDYAMLFKDPTDVVKRNSRLIAAGPSLGTGVSRVAIVKSIAAKDRFDKNTVKDKKIEGLDSQDTTDAQNLGTLNWYINKYLMSSGKLSKEVARIYEKMEKGYRANLEEVRTLKHFNALVNPRKIVGVNRYFYDKTSIKTLLRSETSYMLPENRKEADELYDRIFEARRQGDLILQRELYQRLHSLWKPLPSARANHDLLNKLELDNIDILIFDSAIKTMKANVGTVEGNNEIGFTWNLDPIQVDDESFKEQVKTDSIKSKVVDPTQLLNTVFSEQKLDTKTKVLGKQTTLKDVVDSFEKLVAERSKRGFEEMRKSIISGNLPRYKYLLSMFKDNLMQTGADPYLIEMVSESLSVSGKPEFNLNMPSTIDKLESMFLSYISKNTLKVKAPGHKLTLISDFGSGVMEMNGKIVTDYEFQKNPKKYAGKVSTRRLEFRKTDDNGNLYTEIKISAQFAEHLGLKPGDNIPSELLEMFGVRIPTQDKHSMGYFKVVDFLPMETGTQIMLPYEILKLSGADFDVDAEFLRTFDFFSLNDKPHWFGQYLKAENIEEATEQARQEYIRENSQSKDVKKERDLRLQNNNVYQNLRQILKETKEQLKKGISKERLSTYEDTLEELNNIIEDYFSGDEVGEDNSIPNSVTALPQYSEEQKNKDAALLAATLKQIAIQEKITLSPEEITRLKDYLKTIKSLLRSIETKTGIESLEHFGYPASEEKFKAQFGKTVINNRTAYEKGDFSSINPITIAEINNLLIPLTGSLIYNNSNEEIGNTTTSTKDFDALEETLGAQGIVDETILEGIHDATSKNAAAVSNDTGKENIGPAAVFNLMFQRLHKHKVKFSKAFLKKNPGFNEFIEDLSDGFELTIGPNGEILNKQGIRVNDLIDQIISAMTDNGKDPKAARFNLSYETLGSVLLRIGMGEPFNLAVLTQKQPALVDVVSALQSNKSDLEENKYPKSIIFESEIKKYFDKIKITVNGQDAVNPEFIIDFNEDALIEALKYSQDPNSSRLTEGQYNYIQGFSLQRMAASVEISDYLRNLSDLIGLARGLKPTFAENYNIRNSLEKLGLAVVQKKNTVGDKIEDFEIVKHPNVKEENLPMDVLPMIQADKILSTNIKIFTLMLEDSGKFFVLETKTGREIMDMASISFKDNFLNYKENASMMRKSLLAFLSMKAFRKIRGINNPDINSLFREDLVNLHSKLLQKAEFKNNALLRALIADKIPFGEKNRSNLKGLTLYKLAFNSRTKNNPDYVERLIDDFKLLATSPDPEAKHFAAEAFMYLMMKDSGLFKSDTFIRQIAPIFLKNVSVGLDKVQDLFSNGKGYFSEVFGIPKEELVHEFVELFARYAPNNFYLKGNKLDVILKVNSSKEAIAEIRRLESLEEATSEDVKAVVKEEAPVFYDGIKQTLTFNLKKGVKKGATAEEIERIMGINKSILGTTGLFDEKNGKIIYPPFIQVTMEDGQGGATKRLFKLDILHTGNKIKLDENGNVITDPTYSRNTSDNNLFASEMTGGAATYIPVNPYLEKSIAPWFWTTEELELFRIKREEAENNTDAQIASAEEATTEEQNDILAAIAKLRQSINPIISPSVTPAATPAPSNVSSFFPTSSQPSTSPKQEESSVSADELLGGMAGIRKKLEQKGLSEEAKNRIKNIGKNLKPGTIGESKSSSKQPINQATLTNILDKLSNKFGISWKYDTSIPGLGQFKDGVVLINPNKAKLDTPFHEFAHPFIAIIKIQNPLLYKNLVSQISKTEIGRSTFDKVKKLYPELTYEQQLEETIVDLIGQYAADQQSLKQEKGLWNAIKTFLRRVSEYLKSLLSNENKKVIPSELDPNTTMEELSSMLVIDNPIDLGTMLGKGYKKPAIKPGVQELFDSNPELANQVYDALGVKSNAKTQIAQIKNNNLIITQYSDESFDVVPDKEGIAKKTQEIEQEYKEDLKLVDKIIKDFEEGKDVFNQSDNIANIISNASREYYFNYNTELKSFVSEEFNGDEQFASGEIQWNPKIYDKVFIRNGIEVGQSKIDKSKIVDKLKQGVEKKKKDALYYLEAWESQEGIDRTKKETKYYYDISEFDERGFYNKGLVKSKKGYTLRILEGGSLSSIPGSQGAIKGYGYYHNRIDKKQPDAHIFIDRIDETGVHIRYTTVQKEFQGKGIASIMLNRVRQDYPNLPVHRTLITNPIIVKQSANIQGATDIKGNPLPKFKNDQEIYNWLDDNDHIILPPLNNQITPQQKQQALQLYSQYLDTIFPDSKVKDVVYHGTAAKFDKFEKGHRNYDGRKTSTEGFYFVTEKDKEYYRDKYKGLLSAILNFKNPVTAKDGNYEQALEYLNESDIDYFNSKGFDSGIKFINDPDGEFEYVAFNPEQIHILGNKQDIEGFKEFVDNPVQRVNLDKPTTLFNIFANVADSDVIELINNCN